MFTELKHVARHDVTQGNAGATDTYDPAFFDRLFAVEEQHFWFRARNRVIAAAVTPLVGQLAPGYCGLEVGCGTGNVLRLLENVCDQGTIIGMDLFADALQYARRRTKAPLVRGDARTLPFRAQFALIGLFDVLEHLPDDVQVLQTLWTALAPDGRLLLTVPAHASLWSYFDEAGHHCRRYEMADLEQKLLQCGYEVEFITQFMACLFPLVWLGRRMMRLRHRRSDSDIDHARALSLDELRLFPLINPLLSWVLSQEARLIARRYRLPLGTSLLAIARKRSSTTS